CRDSRRAPPPREQRRPAVAIGFRPCEKSCSAARKIEVAPLPGESVQYASERRRPPSRCQSNPRSNAPVRAIERSSPSSTAARTRPRGLIMSSIVAENLVQREKLLEDFGRPERAGLYVPRVLQQH